MVQHISKRIMKQYPQLMILLSLFSVTIIGALILALPICRVTHISMIDLFFTSASFITVTGLTTIPLHNFTDIGQIIILILIQLGGLGLMTLSLVFLYLFTNLGVYTQSIAGEVLSIRSFKDSKRILFFMIKFTLSIELLGALCIFPLIRSLYPIKQAIFLSIFHAVSSFCNVGVVLFQNNFHTFLQSPIFIIVTMILMVTGGLGFVTWYEILYRLRRKHRSHTTFSWHTKLVGIVYGVSTLISMVLFLLLEYHHSLASLPFFQKIMMSACAAINMKSAGFEFFTMSSMYGSTVLLSMIVMFIGSAPLSTGSGIKTSVFAVYIAIIRAAISGKRHAVLYGRHIVDEQVYKAMAIIALSISWILFIIFLLLIIEPSFPFLSVVYEIVSSFTNQGSSYHITSYLGIMGKFLLILTMIIGRVGALAIIASMKGAIDMHEISYPKERILLG